MFWAAETKEQMVAKTNRTPLQTVLEKKGWKMLFKPPVLTEKERRKKTFL